MSEQVLTTELITAPDPRYMQLPFFNPDAHCEARRNTGVEIVTYFDVAAAADPLILQPAASLVYENEKAPREPDPTRPAGIDLTHPACVTGMLHHTLTHAVSGMVRYGVSGTLVIPYWDRQAAHAGLVRHMGEQEAAHVAEVSDALSINYLRAAARLFLTRRVEFGRYETALAQAMAKGERSKETVGGMQQNELRAAQYERGVYTANAIGKIKHLLWLVDQQPNPHIRHGLLPELGELTAMAQRSGIPAAQLGLDMGRDTGMSQDTHRPPYDISGFVQLQHLRSPTYALQQAGCHQLTLRTIFDSIARPDYTIPEYEAGGRYRLPFAF